MDRFIQAIEAQCDKGGRYCSCCNPSMPDKHGKHHIGKEILRRSARREMNAEVNKLQKEIDTELLCRGIITE